MRLTMVEAHNDRQNWAKFAVGVFEEEWGRRVRIPGDQYGGALLARCGWSREHIWVMDLQTGEGAMFLPGGDAAADLERHQVWVCPLYQPFLTWLYGFIAERRGVADWLAELPEVVDLPEAPFAMRGYRRAGPAEKDRGT